MKNGPWRITFDTNPDHCNLKCIMCEDHSPYSRTQIERINAKLPKRVMDISMIRKMLEGLKDTALTEIIPSTMGEPLVYKHFEEIIYLCHQYNFKMNLTTNGTFPKKGAKKWAELLVPITSDVKISWNGATKETQEKIMLNNNWEQGIQNVKDFIAVRNKHAETGGNYCSVTLQLTFLESNIDELADIVQLGISLGVDRIKGHHLWAHFSEIKNLSLRRNSDSIAKWNAAVIKAKSIAENHHLPNGKPILLDNFYLIEDVDTKNFVARGECPFLGKEAWIATDGKFSPCCAPDKQRQTLGNFGNIHEKSLSEIWQSEAYQALQKNYKEYEVCKNCNMRKH